LPKDSPETLASLRHNGQHRHPARPDPDRAQRQLTQPKAQELAQLFTENKHFY
jgi:hypothetical protein